MYIYKSKPFLSKDSTCLFQKKINININCSLIHSFYGF